LDGLSACWDAAATFVVCLLVGLMEEPQLRGYLQFTLARALGFCWAAMILSAAFGVGHIHNRGETLPGVLSIGASGLFCLSLWYTKSLYWAIGFHAAWDWAQEYFYGNSGNNLAPHLLSTHPVGDPLWSGGSGGPEASNLLLPLLLLLLVGMVGPRQAGARLARGMAFIAPLASFPCPENNAPSNPELRPGSRRRSRRPAARRLM